MVMHSSIPHVNRIGTQRDLGYRKVYPNPAYVAGVPMKVQVAEMVVCHRKKRVVGMTALGWKPTCECSYFRTFSNPMHGTADSRDRETESDDRETVAENQLIDKRRLAKQNDIQEGVAERTHSVSNLETDNEEDDLVDKRRLRKPDGIQDAVKDGAHLAGGASLLRVDQQGETPEMRPLSGGSGRGSEYHSISGDSERASEYHSVSGVSERGSQYHSFSAGSTSGLQQSSDSE